MTRVWSEGFEMKDMVGYAQTYCYADGTPRSGAASMRCLGGFLTTASLTKNITAVSELYFRFATHMGGRETTLYFINGGTTLCTIVITRNNLISISCNGLTDTGTHTILAGYWYLIEVHIKIDNTVGVVEVKVDGLDDCDVSGDTEGAASTITSLYLTTAYSSAAPGGTNYFDDIALNDTAGGVDDSWCGDGRIIVIKPNGDTATLDLTPSAAVGHYTLVDEVPADGDTTYVEGSVDDEEDIYDLEACGLGDVIIARIWTEARVKDTASSGKSVALITLASGGAEVSGGDVALTGTYTTKVLGTEELVNPVDSAAWEVADIDALQGGPRTRP